MVIYKKQKNNTLLNYLCGFAVTVLVFVLFINCASAATLTVGPAKTYSTINSAVIAAVPGDTIIVKPGIYFENVLISTPDLTIRSESGNPDDTVVQAAFPGAPVFTVSIFNVIIDGFKISNGQYGVLLSSAINCTVSNCVATGNTGAGFNIYTSTDCTLVDNVAISNAGYGIHLASGDYSNITRNTVSHNTDHGIIMAEARHTILDSNTFYANGNPSSYGAGISHQRSNNSLLVSNNVSGNYYGIQVDKSYNNIIYNNYFKNSINIYFDNTNQGNVWNTTLTTGTNIIGGPYMGGNYWATSSNNGFSQTTADADFNGICDVQYDLDVDNIDYLPLKTYIPSLESVSDLNETDTGYTWINWSWTNPTASNLNHNMVYLNGSFVDNVTSEYINITGLSEDTIYELGILTVDTSGNINMTWVNDTARTDVQASTPSVVPATSTTRSSGGHGTGSATIRVVDPVGSIDEVSEQESLASDLEETPLQSIPDEPSDNGDDNIGTSFAVESQEEGAESNITPGFGVLASIIVMVSMCLFHRRKD